MMTALRPVLSLLVLAPLISEYLLGSLTFGQLRLFPVMVLLYGGGAACVREVTRRSGRGWPTMLTLALAYGIIEEAILTQSLFNRHYMGHRLLDAGFIPAIGIAAPWTAYVLTLHAVWSMAVPIALVEALYPGRRSVPWMGRIGLAVVGALFALGATAVMLATSSQEHFFASRTQLGASCLVVAAVVSSAFLLFRPVGEAPGPLASPAGGRGLRPWMLGLTTFLCGSAFHLLTLLDSASLSPAEGVALDFVLLGIALAVIVKARRSPNWTFACADGAAIGALLVYCWWGFYLTDKLHGPASIPGHCFPVAVMLALLALLCVRSWGRQSA